MSIKSVFIALLVLCIVYYFIWFYIATKASFKIINFIDISRKNNFDISISNYDSIGYPDSFSTILHNITYRNNKNSFGWKTKSITVAPPLLKSKNILLNTSNDHFFIFRNNKQNNTKKIALRNNLCKVNILLDKKGKQINSIQINALKGIIQFFKEKKSYSYDSLKLNIKKTNVIIENDLTNILELNAEIINIEPDIEWKKILEYNFKYFKSNIYLNNPSSFHELSNFENYANRNYDKPEIIINNLDLMHKLSQFNVQGILTFDNDLTLNGNITLRISDYQKLLSFLSKKNVIDSETETNIRFMLSFMSSTKTLQKNDGTVSIPLNIRRNILYSGEIPIMEINI